MSADQEDTGSDWSSATFEGARREQMRRWAQLPLERILEAIEEMDDLAARLGNMQRGYDRSAISPSSRRRK